LHKSEGTNSIYITYCIVEVDNQTPAR